MAKAKTTKEKVQKTVPTEMITPEMREAGVDETTPLATREEVVAELGEEKVAEIEAGALEMAQGKEVEAETVNDSEKKFYYRGALIVSEIEDVMHYGHMYKSFSTELKETLMISPGEFDADVISK